MKSTLSARLAALRKERGISQKEAASFLGVSQALLSHYENGIRECGIDFIRRACEYYDVTSDYLLCMTDTRHGLYDINSSSEIKTDSLLRTKTCFRSLADLCESISMGSEEDRKLMRQALTLCCYRMALLANSTGAAPSQWFSIDPVSANMLSSEYSRYLNEQYLSATPKDRKLPRAVKTTIDEAERLIKEFYSDCLKKP